MKIFKVLSLSLWLVVLTGCGPTDTDDQLATGQSNDASTPAVVVLGEEIFTENAGEMQSIVIGKLFDQYAQDNQLAATQEEIDQFVASVKKGESERGLTDAGEAYLPSEEATRVATMRQTMARSMIRQWKINRALYQQYGGRIIYQQFGPEPLDAYRLFLQESQQDGSFDIMDSSMEKDFWQYFVEDSIHSFYQQGSDAEKNAYTTPLWEQLLPSQQ